MTPAPADRIAYFTRVCADSIAQVPVEAFALLIVTAEAVEVRACPHEQLEALLTGCIEPGAVAHLVAKRDACLVRPGYREHFIVVLEVHDAEADWEPPNVTSVGASVAVLHLGERGQA